MAVSKSVPKNKLTGVSIGDQGTTALEKSEPVASAETSAPEKSTCSACLAPLESFDNQALIITGFIVF